MGDELGVCGAAGAVVSEEGNAAAVEELAARVSLSAKPNSCAARSRCPAATRAWAREAKAGAESGFSCCEEEGEEKGVGGSVSVLS